MWGKHSSPCLRRQGKRLKHSMNNHASDRIPYQRNETKVNDCVVGEILNLRGARSSCPRKQNNEEIAKEKKQPKQ